MCAKFHLDLLILSGVIIRTSSFSSILSKKGAITVRMWWSVTRFELDLPFTFLYICAKFHLDPWILSWVIIRTSSFSSILSQKGAITLSEFGGVWQDSNLTFLLWVYTYVQNIIWIYPFFQELSSGHRHFPQFWVKKGPLLCQNLVECDQIRTWPSFYGYIHMCKILFGSINPFRSYCADKDIFPNFK